VAIQLSVKYLDYQNPKILNIEPLIPNLHNKLADGNSCRTAEDDDAPQQKILALDAPSNIQYLFLPLLLIYSYDSEITCKFDDQ